MEPTALRSTFRLKDLSDLLQRRPRKGLSPSEPGARTTVARVVESAHHRRTRGLHAVFSHSGGDLIDPFGRSARDFDRMAAQVDGLLPPLVRTLRTLHAEEARRG